MSRKPQKQKLGSSKTEGGGNITYFPGNLGRLTKGGGREKRHRVPITTSPSSRRREGRSKSYVERAM